MGHTVRGVPQISESKKKLVFFLKIQLKLPSHSHFRQPSANILILLFPWTPCLIIQWPGSVSSCRLCLPWRYTRRAYKAFSFFKQCAVGKCCVNIVSTIVWEHEEPSSGSFITIKGNVSCFPVLHGWGGSKKTPKEFLLHRNISFLAVGEATMSPWSSPSYSQGQEAEKCSWKSHRLTQAGHRAPASMGLSACVHRPGQSTSWLSSRPPRETGKQAAPLLQEECLWVCGPETAVEAGVTSSNSWSLIETRQASSLWRRCFQRGKLTHRCRLS